MPQIQNSEVIAPLFVQLVATLDHGLVNLCILSAGIGHLIFEISTCDDQNASTPSFLGVGNDSFQRTGGGYFIKGRRIKAVADSASLALTLRVVGGKLNYNQIKIRIGFGSMVAQTVDIGRISRNRTSYAATNGSIDGSKESTALHFDGRDRTIKRINPKSRRGIASAKALEYRGTQPQQLLALDGTVSIHGNIFRIIDITVTFILHAGNCKQLLNSAGANYNNNSKDSS